VAEVDADERACSNSRCRRYCSAISCALIAALAFRLGPIPSVASGELGIDCLDGGTKLCDPSEKIGSLGSNSAEIRFTIRILLPVVADVVAVGAERPGGYGAAPEVFGEGVDDLAEALLEVLVVEPLDEVQDPRAVRPPAGGKLPRAELLVL